MGPKIHKVFEKGPETFGAGEIVYSFSNDMSFIAACGESKNVKVFDRRGGQLKECQLNSDEKVLALEWDKDNEILAILQNNLGYIQ
jgi:WD repeat-containing protein 19